MTVSRLRIAAGTAVWTSLCALGGFASPSAAHAVEVTDVLDAADDQNGDPFDFAVRLRFTTEQRRSSIARETKCVSSDQLGSQMCPRGSQYLYAKELDYERVRNTLNIDLRAGVYKDLELYITAPVVIGDDWQHKFASGVSQRNSSILPPSSRDALFAVPFQSTPRSGLGDMRFGVRWAPFNYERDRSQPTWVFGVEYTAPTGTPMKANKNGVGQGLHEVSFYTTISRRALQIFEPFFNMHATPVRSGSSSSLFQNYNNDTQLYTSPGFVAGTQFGLTVLPWEDAKKDQRLEIEAGFGMDYIARGREYTEIWEALASRNNPCKPEEGCFNTVHYKSQPDSKGQLRVTDGITDVDSYSRYQGWAAVHWQPLTNFQFSVKWNYMTETPHFISFGSAGVDLDGKDKVSISNSQGENEYSPVYLPSIDQVGSRLRVQDVSGTTWMISATGKF